MSMFATPVEYPLRVLVKQAELVVAGEVERVCDETASIRVSRAWKANPGGESVRVRTHSGVL